MKATLPLLLGSLFLSLVLTGCSSSSTGTTGGPPPPTGPTNFVYTANSAGNPSTVSALVSDATGALSSLTLSPYNADLGAFAVKADPTGKYLYVANRSSGDISGFSIDASTGGLAPTPTPTFAVEIGVDALVIDPAGKFLYAVSGNSVNLYGFSIDNATGALAPLSFSPMQIDPTVNSSNAIAIDPSGKYLFTTTEGSTTAGVYAFSRDMTTGALSSVGAPVTVDHGTHDMATDPSGKFVFVPATGTSTLFGTLTVFSLNTTTGGLTAIGSPTHTGVDPASVAIDASGKYVYTANTADVTISAFTLDSTTGALTAVGAPIPSGGNGNTNGPTGIAIESSGSFVFVCNASNDISVFKIGSGGALTAISNSPFPSKGSGPNGITVVKKP